MLADPKYPELVPCPAVKFVQSDAYGELTRGLAYRLSGLNLRLIGGKGCGKNTLAQTLDWILNVPQYRMQGNAEMDKLDLLGGPTIENGTLRYKLSDMLRYIEAGADVVLDEGNTIKPECADVLHSLTDEARRIQVPGYGLVKMHPKSSFTITMNEGYAGTNYMNEATIDRFTPIQMSEHESVKEILRRVVPTASEHCLNVCDVVYCAIKSRIDSAGGLEPDAMTIRGLVDALRAEPLLGLRWGLMDNVAAKPEARRICCVMILMDGIGPPACAFCLRMRCSMITARMPTRSKECAKMQRASLPSRAFARSSGVYSGRD